MAVPVSVHVDLVAHVHGDAGQAEDSHMRIYF